MKQSVIIEAYNTMESLAENQNLTDDEQWEIYKLRKMLRPHFDFQKEREEQIKAKYLEFADKDGNVSKEIGQKYMDDLKAVADLDIEIEEFAKPEISNKGINFLTMEKLDYFIEFVKR